MFFMWGFRFKEKIWQRRSVRDTVTSHFPNPVNFPVNHLYLQSCLPALHCWFLKKIKVFFNWDVFFKCYLFNKDKHKWTHKCSVCLCYASGQKNLLLSYLHKTWPARMGSKKKDTLHWCNWVLNHRTNYNNNNNNVKAGCSQANTSVAPQ